jgi:hypothetical protein
VSPLVPPRMIEQWIRLDLRNTCLRPEVRVCFRSDAVTGVLLQKITSGFCATRSFADASICSAFPAAQR